MIIMNLKLKSWVELSLINGGIIINKIESIPIWAMLNE